MPKDEDVAAVEERRRLDYEEYVRLTQWHTEVPKRMKFVLATSGLMTTFAAYLVFFAGSALGEDCFKECEINDTIEDKLDGNAFNLVNKFGWLAVVLCILGYINLRIYQRWASRKVRKSIAKNQVAPVTGAGAVLVAATGRYPLGAGRRASPGVSKRRVSS